MKAHAVAATRTSTPVPVARATPASVRTVASPPFAVVALNLGGPDSMEAVRPFLRELAGDPNVFKGLGPLRPLFAYFFARGRTPKTRELYRQIGGRSPIAEESAAQAAAVAAELARRGLPAHGYVAMACWHPFSEETVRDIHAHGIARAVALPLYPHYSWSTTAASFDRLARAADRAGGHLEIARVERYPDAPGFVEAMADRVCEAIAELPFEAQDRAPVIFSAHGLPESYIRSGDPYLDDIRITVQAVARRLELGDRARLAFQSRVGPVRWLTPNTADVLTELGAQGETSVVVVPVAFTGEHVETLQEIDIVFRQLAEKAGVTHFARAGTVGCHPAFIRALADLVEAEVRAHGWAEARP
jgi:protoporphyrin/coproporphyrin ferrochelatase